MDKWQFTVKNVHELTQHSPEVFVGGGGRKRRHDEGRRRNEQVPVSEVHRCGAASRAALAPQQRTELFSSFTTCSITHSAGSAPLSPTWGNRTTNWAPLARSLCLVSKATAALNPRLCARFRSGNVDGDRSTSPSNPHPLLTCYANLRLLGFSGLSLCCQSLGAKGHGRRQSIVPLSPSQREHWRCQKWSCQDCSIFSQQILAETLGSRCVQKATAP